MTPLALYCSSPIVPGCLVGQNSNASKTNGSGRFKNLKVCSIMSSYCLDTCAPVILLIIGILGAVGKLHFPPAASYSLIGGSLAWGVFFWVWAAKTGIGSKPFFKKSN